MLVKLIRLDLTQEITLNGKSKLNALIALYQSTIALSKKEDAKISIWVHERVDAL